MVLLSPTEFFTANVGCCTEQSDHISKRLLQRVKSYAIQQNNGICDIRAILLYTKHKVLCANPNNVLIHKWIQKNKPNQYKKKISSMKRREKRKGRKKQRRKSLKCKNTKPNMNDDELFFHS
ncbi:hypothetical protein GDO86_002444, partial [Hymenochirus boettgeri]